MWRRRMAGGHWAIGGCLWTVSLYRVQQRSASGCFSGPSGVSGPLLGPELGAST